MYLCTRRLSELARIQLCSIQVYVYNLGSFKSARIQLLSIQVYVYNWGLSKSSCIQLWSIQVYVLWLYSQEAPMGLGPTPTKLHYRRQSGRRDTVSEDRLICVHGVIRQ